MPPGGARLSDDQYLAIVAYILRSNGAAPGAQPLTAATAVPIGTIATGQRPAAQAQAPSNLPTPAAAPQVRLADAVRLLRSRRGRGPRRPGRAIPFRRAERAGRAARPDRRRRSEELRPVTDEMLRNPPPGDWLMVRRNYQALELQPARRRSRATT